MTPEEAARCVKAASQFARRYEPESTGFARDLNTAAELIESQQKEVERLRRLERMMIAHPDTIAGDVLATPPPTDRWAGEHNRPDGSPCGYLLVTGAPVCLKCGTPAPVCPTCRRASIGMMLLDDEGWVPDCRDPFHTGETS